MFKTTYKWGLLLVLLCSLTSVFSQPYGNEWINYTQQYYKFKVAETGIYRIDSTTLSNAGMPLSIINPQNIQVFGRGIEIPIYIEGENDGVFDGADFIEFYAQKNDGWYEEKFYGAAANHPNPYYSLINDTATYFITWNTSTNNNRLILETDTNFTSFTPIPFFTKESLQFYNSQFYDGRAYPVGSESINLAGYDPTEGWFDNQFEINSPWNPDFKTKTLNTKNVYTSGNPARLDAVVLGESDYANLSNDHHLQVSVGSNLIDTIYGGYQKVDLQMDIPLSDLGSNSTNVTFQSVNDLGSGADRNAISYVKLQYPHTPDMEGSTTFRFIVDNHPTESKSYLNFTNFSATGQPLLYDITNGKRIDVILSGSNYNCLIPNAAGEKECYLSSVGQVKNVNSITAINGTGFFTDYLTAEVDTAFLIVTQTSLMQGANDYAAYRLNPVGGNNPQNAVVFDVEELYDQFAYGIRKHPYSIRGFTEFVVDNWTSTPRYLFLMGKSIKPKEMRANATDFNNNLVPTFGNPSSDMMLTSGLNGTSREPLIPTGRIAAKNNTEVSWYLNKVIDFENPVLTPQGTDVTEWMKKVLHFAGGTSSNQANTFEIMLGNMENVIEDTLFGGDVTTFTKSSSVPIQTSFSDSIMDLVEDGVALMTFFGHASATGGFDQNINDPNLWPEQNGKYPFLIGLSCFTGDIHGKDANSTSEEHVILEDKGTIGFLASSDLGLLNELNNYGQEFYENISYKNYRGSYGNMMKQTIIATQGNLFSNNTASTVTLHGDPSLSFYGFDKPDYMIAPQTVTFNPSVVTSDLSTFDVNVVITNLGRAIHDTISVELTRSFADPSFPDTLYTASIPATFYKDTVTFTLPVDLVKGLGQNTFIIAVDAPLPFGKVEELVEPANNEVTKTLTILSGEIIPIYPYEFMIVPNQGITLSASTAFPFEPAKNYIFELDTTDYFNSPIKQTTTINSAGGIVSWTPSLLQAMPDSMVYFWRVGKDSVDATGYAWRNRSFQYIKDHNGWEQEHFFQFDNDEFQFLKHNRSTRKYQFVNDVKLLKAFNYGNADWSELNKIKYLINLDIIGKNGWLTSAAVHVAVLDSLTLEPWSAVDRPNYGHVNNFSAFSGSSQEHFFIFRHNSATQMTDLENFIKDSIPNGNHILMWSWYVVGIPGFSYPLTPGLKTEFANIGASQLSTLPDKYPFVLYYKKGNNSSTIEVVGDSINHKNLQLSTSLIASANFANITSPVIGPSTRWDSLSWRVNPIEQPTTQDSSVLNVFGVDALGNETLLYNSLPIDSGDIRLTNTIDANQYPYLKLNTYLSDDSLFTAPQLDRWHVTYADVPEAALDPKIFYTFNKDTVQEGEEISLEIAIKNISKYDMDSLLISFAIFDKNLTTNYLPYPRQKPLLADSVMIARLTFSTLGFKGLNYLMIDVNPNNDQLEKYHFNNVAQIPFYVEGDNINPLLDVTFDGIHILDGDIVSPKAEIVVELTDENQYLLLDDTTDFDFYITEPNGIEKRVYFIENGQQRMEFIPASLPKNNAKIILQGDFSVDGIYKLRVRASDKSKNNSGDLDYLISFEVINESTITNIVNYPNPFTTSTRFVFTLTGSEVPDIFKIQIMTITGKVVREIHKEELGPINIGRNISTFAWNGTDMYGDRLANGVYFYHVITQINSKEIKHRDTSADFYFKKGFGKMYLFR